MTAAPTFPPFQGQHALMAIIFTHASAEQCGSGSGEHAFISGRRSRLGDDIPRRLAQYAGGGRPLVRPSAACRRFTDSLQREGRR